MAVDLLDVNEFGSHAQRGVARSQRAGEDGHKSENAVARSRVVRAVHCVARCSGKRGATRGQWDRDVAAMVAKTDTSEFFIMKYKVTDMYNY